MTIALPISVEFSAAFLASYFEVAPTEVRKQWDRVHAYLGVASSMAEALRPFANFIGTATLPDDFVITMGSMMAKSQLTAGDCRRACTALDAAA